MDGRRQRLTPRSILEKSLAVIKKYDSNHSPNNNKQSTIESINFLLLHFKTPGSKSKSITEATAQLLRQNLLKIRDTLDINTNRTDYIELDNALLVLAEFYPCNNKNDNEEKVTDEIICPLTQKPIPATGPCLFISNGEALSLKGIASKISWPRKENNLLIIPYPLSPRDVYRIDLFLAECMESRKKSQKNTKEFEAGVIGALAGFSVAFVADIVTSATPFIPFLISPAGGIAVILFTVALTFSGYQIGKGIQRYRAGAESPEACLLTEEITDLTAKIGSVVENMPLQTFENLLAEKQKLESVSVSSNPSSLWCGGFCVPKSAPLTLSGSPRPLR